MKKLFLKKLFLFTFLVGFNGTDIAQSFTEESVDYELANKIILSFYRLDSNDLAKHIDESLEGKFIVDKCDTLYYVNERYSDPQKLANRAISYIKEQIGPKVKMGPHIYYGIRKIFEDDTSPINLTFFLLKDEDSSILLSIDLHCTFAYKIECIIIDFRDCY